MAEIAMLYSTTDGHTRKIVERMAEIIGTRGHRVTVMDLGDDSEIDLTPYATVVIGASIRYGKHSPKVYRFIEKAHPQLQQRANAFFSVNVVARKPNRNTPETNPYLQKFLRQIPWQPQHLAVFAGKIDYPRYRFWDRQMIRLIMWITHGPTAADAVVEFTDWQQVEDFSRRVCEL